MIGVIVHPEERAVAAEFFELYKTAWEFYQSGRHYDILICTADPPERKRERLVVLFGAAATRWDSEQNAVVKSAAPQIGTTPDGKRFPLYGPTATFPGQKNQLLTSELSGEPLAWGHKHTSDKATTVRVGYNIFTEIQLLITTGQPVEYAPIPTLELHIAFLRHWIIRAGLPSIEIPPVPGGFQFIACLTHDIDHASMRNHCLDRTMLGFVYRAIIGTIADVCRGKRPLYQVKVNWSAAAKLPLVYLGLARDPWADFDRYLKLEAGRPSTFYVIPTRNEPGRTADGYGPAARVCRYDIDRLRPQLKNVISAGGEVGVHGLDAWIEPNAACDERAKVEQTIGTPASGIRMHWLYSNERTPAILENAGFTYDSTAGYNETIGYRSGTAQAFKPAGTSALLELPLHIMDTALFSPSMMALDAAQAAQAAQCTGTILEEVSHYGGALTINWHDRSIAPERLWTAFYTELMNRLTQQGAWFATANQAVSWFRKRRAFSVAYAGLGSRNITVKSNAAVSDDLPSLRLRVYKPCPGSSSIDSAEFVDYSLNQTAEQIIAI